MRGFFRTRYNPRCSKSALWSLPVRCRLEASGVRTWRPRERGDVIPPRPRTPRAGGGGAGGWPPPPPPPARGPGSPTLGMGTRSWPERELHAGPRLPSPHTRAPARGRLEPSQEKPEDKEGMGRGRKEGGSGYPLP